MRFRLVGKRSAPIDLCDLKGHMWYFSKREDVEREDGLYSVATERSCARCSETEVV